MGYEPEVCLGVGKGAPEMWLIGHGSYFLPAFQILFLNDGTSIAQLLLMSI